MDNILGDNNGEQRFAIKIAGFNLLFLFLGVVILSGIYAVYQIMNMFILAMIWAVLIGTVLFPVKYCIRQNFICWLKELDETDTPFIVGLAKLPYNYFIAISDWMHEFAWSINGLFAILVFTTLKLLSYENTLSSIFLITGSLYNYVDYIINFINNSSWLFPLFILYTCAYLTWLYVQNIESIHKKFARTLSLPIWIYLLAYISGYTGPLRVIVFAGVAIILGLISAGIVDPGDGQDELNNENVKFTESKEEENEVSDMVENIQEQVQKVSENVPILEEITHTISADTNLKIISILVFAMWIIKHEFFFVLCFFLLIFASIKKICHLFGIFESIKHYLLLIWNALSPQFHKIFVIIAAGPLRKTLKLLFTSDRFMISTLKAKADTLSTIFVMGLLAFGSIFVLCFVAFELHNETIHLVRIGSDVVASNREWFKYAVNYTEDQIREHNIDDYIEQAYQQGRTWLASNVRKLADPKDTERADELEKQAIILIDQLYQLWDEKASELNSTNTLATTSSNSILDNLSDLTTLSSFKTELTNIIKNNIDTILSILQSLWSVIVVNVSVLNTIMFKILSFIFGFGFDMINSFIEIIVFLTMIFYLLAYSEDQWLPLKFIETVASFFNSGKHDVNNKTKDNITVSIENAIKGVFVLSAKMSVFYGLYTYFLHSLFNLNIVFIPSLLASLFAAIPIIPAYSVFIFGAIELYFVRQETVATLVFVVMSIAPIGFADGAFYSEVKNSHPYVTGLAIIGGMYWLGLQGIIFGPIILCSMIALINMYIQFSS